MSGKKVSLPSNHVELFVKSGYDGENNGACPFCQRFFMILDLKAQEDTLTYKVIIVNPARPTADVKSYIHKLPVLKHEDEVIMDSDEMVQYIDENFPHPDLRYTNRQAHTVCLDVFSKFNFFIKNVSHTADPLIKELNHIDGCLRSTGTRFLCGDELTHLDCLMLPKLHHIRVASQAFKDFEIPSTMTGIWKYLKNAYACDTFRKTCPSDQEIVNHWSTKRETTPLPKSKQRLYMLEGPPVFSMDIAQANGQVY